MPKALLDAWKFKAGSKMGIRERERKRRRLGKSLSHPVSYLLFLLLLYADEDQCFTFEEPPLAPDRREELFGAELPPRYTLTTTFHAGSPSVLHMKGLRVYGDRQPATTNQRHGLQLHSPRTPTSSRAKHRLSRAC